jgi:hypothetical protein
MGEPEDDDPAKIRSVIQGCGGFGINHLGTGLGVISTLLDATLPGTAGAFI